jgi:hypothetical protein
MGPLPTQLHDRWLDRCEPAVGSGTLYCSYSTAAQPAEPVIAAPGKRVPTRCIAIDRLSLVVQWGPERLWDRETVGTVKL